MLYKVCAVQASSTKYDKIANLNKIESFMKRAGDLNANAIVFPEMYLTGYSVYDGLVELSEDINGKSLKQIALWAKKYKLLTIVGFPESNSSGLPYNSACVIESDGKILGAYQKVHLVGNENKYFNPGDNVDTFNTSLGNIGVIICYDVEFPEISRILAIRGAKLVFMLAANMRPYEDYHIRYTPVRAMENSLFMVSCNHILDDGIYEYCGLSAIVDPKGDFLALGSADKEELLYAEIDLLQTHSNDNILNYLSHRRPELYHTITNTLSLKREEKKL